MTIRIGFRGYAYDDAAYPLFVDLQNGFVINRMTMSVMTKASLDAAMAAASYTAESYEYFPSLAWEAAHTGDWNKEKETVTITQPTGLPKTGDSTGTQFASIGCDFGGPITEICAATVTYKIGSGATKTLKVNLTIGNSSTQANTAIAAALDTAESGLTCTATATTIKVTPADTVVLTSLILAVA